MHTRTRRVGLDRPERCLEGTALDGYHGEPGMARRARTPEPLPHAFSREATTLAPETWSWIKKHLKTTHNTTVQ